MANHRRRGFEPTGSVPDDEAAVPPAGLSGELQQDWQDLFYYRNEIGPFDEAMLTDLPEPTRRWLIHAITPGTRLSTSGVFQQQGEIKISRWVPYAANWLIAPPQGFIWAAACRVGPVALKGFDSYTRDAGQMRWRLMGRIPFIRADGPDVTRSAAGRLAAELFFVPAVAFNPSVSWQALDDDRAIASVRIGTEVHRVTITVAPSGALLGIALERWGNPAGRSFAQHLFTAELGGETHLDGFTVPRQAKAGWWRCPDGCAPTEFIRFTIESGRFL